ncbi:MAG: metallopeptidase family protein [Candidatus Saganbacteria bacterium]|nr:metallopeptidase family protein [Candidatus Saganbacteria bacterium]
MELQEFEKYVEAALRDIPPKFRDLLENITIEVEPKQLSYTKDHHLILGLYKGVPFSYRGPAYRNVLPDKIIIYKKAFDRYPEAKLPEMIKNVLQHEIGHYFGMTEEELAKYKKC